MELVRLAALLSVKLDAVHATDKNSEPIILFYFCLID